MPLASNDAEIINEEGERRRGRMLEESFRPWIVCLRALEAALAINTEAEGGTFHRLEHTSIVRQTILIFNLFVLPFSIPHDILKINSSDTKANAWGHPCHLVSTLKNFLEPIETHTERLLFSFCFYLQFKELTYGFQKTNASTLLRSCLEYVMNHHNYFLPGEGGYLLDLLQDVSFYCEENRQLLFPFASPFTALHFTCLPPPRPPPSTTDGDDFEREAEKARNGCLRGRSSSSHYESSPFSCVYCVRPSGFSGRRRFNIIHESASAENFDAFCVLGKSLDGFPAEMFCFLFSLLLPFSSRPNNN